jgi:hypothetical protein
MLTEHIASKAAYSHFCVDTWRVMEISWDIVFSRKLSAAASFQLFGLAVKVY